MAGMQQQERKNEGGGLMNAGTVLWDGRFNNMTSSTELNNWSFSNPVGEYQYYIHGNGPVTDYVNLAANYDNPADESSNKGVKITTDATAVWNGQNMLRTELIPQTTTAINKGKVYYHFSVQHTGLNPPSANHEHQVCFFESHFTELKFGASGGDSALRWEVNGQSKWDTNFTAGVWHNVAYAIDFDKQTVGFWHSTGGDALTLAAGPFAVSADSNGADWHLGVLRLNTTAAATYTAAEDWYFSGVYIENGDLTTAVSGPGDHVGSAAMSSESTSKSSSNTTKTASLSKSPSRRTRTRTRTRTSSVRTADAAVAQSLYGYGVAPYAASSSSVDAVAASYPSEHAASSSAVAAVHSGATRASMWMPITTANAASSASTLSTVSASSSNSAEVVPVASSTVAQLPSMSRYTAPAVLPSFSAPVLSVPAIADVPFLTMLSAFVPYAATTAYATNEISLSLAAAATHGACTEKYAYA
ncbi:hypothetical protein MBLNU457_2336t2 [Dothideomycetes sp. NU457]